MLDDVILRFCCSMCVGRRNEACRRVRVKSTRVRKESLAQVPVSGMQSTTFTND
jgi:hypothetical protein